MIQKGQIPELSTERSTSHVRGGGGGLNSEMTAMLEKVLGVLDIFEILVLDALLFGCILLA